MSQVPPSWLEATKSKDAKAAHTRVHKCLLSGLLWHLLFILWCWSGDPSSVPDNDRQPVPTHLSCFGFRPGVEYSATWAKARYFRSWRWCSQLVVPEFMMSRLECIGLSATHGANTGAWSVAYRSLDIVHTFEDTSRDDETNLQQRSVCVWYFCKSPLELQVWHHHQQSSWRCRSRHFCYGMGPATNFTAMRMETTANLSQLLTLKL